MPVSPRSQTFGALPESSQSEAVLPPALLLLCFGLLIKPQLRSHSPLKTSEHGFYNHLFPNSFYPVAF